MVLDFLSFLDLSPSLAGYKAVANACPYPTLYVSPVLTADRRHRAGVDGNAAVLDSVSAASGRNTLRQRPGWL